MRALRITLFILAFVILSSQTFRHAYVRWIEHRGSVLDKYDTDTEKQITEANSLDELLRSYDVAHTQVEKEKAARSKETPNAERGKQPPWQRRDEETDAEKNERTLRSA